jgi:hypothetical protein
VQHFQPIRDKEKVENIFGLVRGVNKPQVEIMSQLVSTPDAVERKSEIGKHLQK